MQSTFMDKLEDVLLPIADKLNNNKYLASLRDGFMIALPLIIFGSIFVVIANFPFLDKLLSESQYTAWQDAVGPASAATLSIMGLFVILGIGYKLTERNGLEGIYGAVTALSAVLILTPQVVGKTEGVIPTEILGAKGMFLGIIVSIITSELYSYFTKKEITIKMPKGLPATIIAVLFIQIFWFFGLHGQIIVNTVFDPIWYSLNNENFEAFQKGIELPNIITKQFIDTFLVGMGGTGGTIAVVIAIYLICRSKQNKEIAKLGTPASIFNVNEPILFGLPIIMNPLVIIPWIISPVIVTIVSYSAMYTGIVPKPSGVIVPWTTPIFISGYLATGNAWQGAALQLVNLIITFIIWWPFLKLLDKNYLKQEIEK